MRVALLGTGTMSGPMGRRLLAAGHELHAWNRTRARERCRPVSFALRLAHKDAGLIVEAAEATGLDLPLPRLVRERMGRAIAAGHGDGDLAATVEASRS